MSHPAEDLSWSHVSAGPAFQMIDDRGELLKRCLAEEARTMVQELAVCRHKVEDDC
jgi:hypothetical protein